MGERLDRLLTRLRRFERRELRELHRWLERTSNLVHLSILLAIPLLMGLVTALSNAVGSFSFLVYPPLASGAYTLFANPEGEYASPVQFVGGLTAGALLGWVAVVVAVNVLYPSTPGEIHAAGAALSVFLTGAATWALDIEEPAAFSTALLTLFVHSRIETLGLYVLSVAVGSAIVAVAFLGWRDLLYERRAEFLYESVRGDDHVLVVMRGQRAGATAMLAGTLASAHRAGKVVLLDIVQNEETARAERALLREHDETRLADRAGGYPRERPEPSEEVADSVERLEARASTIETRLGVPCEVVVATGEGAPAGIVERTAREANCDLIATPYEAEHGTVTTFVRDLFRATVDVVVHRSQAGRERWKRVLVLVRGPSDVAHNSVEFATRLAGATGEVSVGTCIQSEGERRRAERTLADLVGAFEGNIETRVSKADVETFIDRHGEEYDLVIIGASQDRSVASRFISPPTFERINSDDVGTDIAIVDRR